MRAQKATIRNKPLVFGKNNGNKVITEVTMQDNNENNCGQSKSDHIYYKCTVCGVMHDGKDGAPKSCMKCDNDKFFKVTK